MLEKKKDFVTEPTNPFQLIATVDGEIRYVQWCDKVIAHINACNPKRKAYLWRDYETGNVAVKARLYRFERERL